MYPFFYEHVALDENSSITLSDDNAKHLALVLRKTEGDFVYLVNGKGEKALCKLISIEKKKVIVNIISKDTYAKRSPKLYIAVGFTKNRNRNELMLEKLTEIGVDYIIPLNCKRSERDTINKDRLNSIMAAAMIQSQQVFLPKLLNLSSIKHAIELYKEKGGFEILLAHCLDQDKLSLYESLEDKKASLLMIGPEGDFTDDEIKFVIENGGKAVSFGPNRLRTETAAIYACTTFNQKHYAQ